MTEGRKVVIEAFGERPMDAVERHLRVVAQPRPAPDALAPRDVLIAVKSSCVGWVDLLMTSGQYQHMPAPPYTPGMEYAGEVAWVGPEVTGVKVGDRVIGDAFRVGPRSLGDYQGWGGFASWAVAPEEAVIPLPGPLDFDQGACLLGAYETAWHCLIHRGRLRRGETVLVHGASGATGLAAVHVAKKVGATVIATGRSEDKLRVVEAQGADHVIATGEGGFRDAVKALTGGAGVDVVYDPVGGEVSLESLRCVRFGARFLIVGWASTPFVARGKGQRGAPNANVLPTNLIMMKSLDVLGCPAVISAHRDPEMRARRLAEVLAWAEEGAITPLVAERRPLEEAAQAMKDKWSSCAVGAIVLRP